MKVDIDNQEDLKESEQLENEIIEETEVEVCEDSKNNDKKNKKVKEKKNKGKKDKKVKENKEENNFEKKKGSKKILIIPILFLIIIAIGFTVFKMLPVIMGDKGDSYQVNIKMDYKKNLIYNKYPVTVSFNNSSIGTIEQGKDLEYSTDLHNGSYVITFTESDNPDNTVSGIVQVDGNTNYQYKLKADWKGITFNESVNPIGFKMDSIPAEDDPNMVTVTLTEEMSVEEVADTSEEVVEE